MDTATKRVKRVNQEGKENCPFFLNEATYGREKLGVIVVFYSRCILECLLLGGGVREGKLCIANHIHKVIF